MSHETDLELWQESAKVWIEMQGRTGDASRLQLDPIVLEKFDSVAGLSILDIGCGHGRFAHRLAELGAKVVGIDPVAEFAEHAALGRGRYAKGSATELPVANESFDLALMYLVIIDIEDYRKALREAFRVLKPGGKFILANLTSMSTATAEEFWHRDSEGRKLARRVEFYGEERSVVYEWGGIRIRNHHRPLANYLNAFVEAGFLLERFEEPVFEGDEGSLMAPNFNVQVWRKHVVQQAHL